MTVNVRVDVRHGSRRKRKHLRLHGVFCKQSSGAGKVIKHVSTQSEEAGVRGSTERVSHWRRWPASTTTAVVGCSSSAINRRSRDVVCRIILHLLERRIAVEAAELGPRPALAIGTLRSSKSTCESLRRRSATCEP